MRILFYIIVFQLSLGHCFAQKQANIWYFGQRLGLDFNVEPPNLLLDGKIEQDSTSDNLEAAASISDSNGNLLFYTNGVTIWSNNHSIMQNGTGLFGRNTTTQTLIVPKPGIDSTYYVFSASPEGDAEYYPIENRGFHYSIVDMTQEGKLGAVVQKNIKLTTSTTEKMAATQHVNGRDIWIVMHEWNSDVFRSYLMTENGISPNPVISRSGSIHTGGVSGIEEDKRNAIGQMKFSPDGEKLALVISRVARLEVFSFSPLTGQLKLKDSISIRGGRFYGLEFSPNGRYLYVSPGCSLYQLDLNKDLSVDNFVWIEDGSPCYETSQLQLAPNGKIYAAQFAEFFIGVINKPNEAGALCAFEDRAIEWPIGNETNRCSLGLPNFMSSYFYKPEFYPGNPYLEMPNVFTPNSDGLNDTFKPLYIHNIEQWALTIYNRWGKQIFSNDKGTGWDGGDVTSGVYFWEIKYIGKNGKSGQQKGTASLIR